MPEQPLAEPEKAALQRYDRLLSLSDPDEQLRVLLKERRDDIMEKLLSEDAPEGLIRRFAPKHAQVLDRLTGYEKGRVLMEAEIYDQATEAFKRAAATGDKRGELGAIQAELYSAAKNGIEVDLEEIIGKTQAIVDGGYQTAEALVALGTSLGTAGKKTLGKAAIEKAIAISQGPDQDYYKALILLQEKSDSLVRPARRAAERGHLKAIDLLEVHFRSKKDWRAALKYTQLGIKFGAVKKYIDEGQTYEKLNKPQEAAASYQKALSLGLVEADILLAPLLAKEGRLPEASNRKCREGKTKEAWECLAQAKKLKCPLPITVMAALVLIENTPIQSKIAFLESHLESNPLFHFFIVGLLPAKEVDKIKFHLREGIRLAGINDLGLSEEQLVKSKAIFGLIFEKLIESFGDFLIGKTMIDSVKLPTIAGEDMPS